MTDARDTNHDGKVSMMEKVKGAFHHNNATGNNLGNTNTGNNLGHTNNLGNTAYNTTGLQNTGALPAGAVPIIGQMPVAMPLAGAAIPVTGACNCAAGACNCNSRDLNRDGHVSTTERFVAGSGNTQSYGNNFDSRDLNRDGHISTGERLAAGHTNESERIRLHEEQLAISKRAVGAGEVDVHKRVHEAHVQQTVPVTREEVFLERRPLSGVADANARIADETVRVPLSREEILTEKRVIPVEEVIVRKNQVTDQQSVGATLRSEHVDTVQTGSQNFGAQSVGTQGSGMYDARDSNRDGHVSMGEKFKGAAVGNAPNAARG